MAGSSASIIANPRKRLFLVGGRSTITMSNDVGSRYPLGSFASTPIVTRVEASTN